MRTAIGASLGPDTPLTLPLARAPPSPPLARGAGAHCASPPPACAGRGDPRLAPSPRWRGEGRGEGSGAALLPAQQRHALMRLRAFAGEILMQSTSLVVNGSAVSVTADADTPLLDVLRNHLGLMGTKFGCGQEQCGCRMVLVDGRPEKSCGKPLSTMAGK